MPDLAGTLGQTYRIPRQHPSPYSVAAPGRVAAEQPFNDGLDFEKNLQEVEGQTEDYYQSIAALKSFMADMHKNLGIDVRVPDMSKPESIRLNMVYQQALADIMHKGNALHEGQTERLMRINRGDQYTKEADGKPDSQIRQGVEAFPSNIPGA
ncbi:MAG: hypothetical protein KGJ87_11815, partial [Planctomycetota bacterium]|nr:hypothetical protein [Planctomycetota bacterium]